jgi:outer membrane protein
MSKLRSIVTLLILGQLLSQSAFAEEAEEEQKPKWTFGVGMMAASLPHYAGSDESRSLFVPFPYIGYKSKTLTIDRSGMRRNLWSNDSLELTWSGAGSIKIDSAKNKARQGMPDLGWVGATGPALKWLFDDDKSLFAQIAIRKAFAFDSGIDGIGWQGETSLNWYSKRTQMGERGTLGFQVIGKLKFADNKYNNYYYGVGNRFATATRPAYEASSGYAGAELLAGFNYKSERYWAGLFARYSNINGVTFENSPLVRKEQNFSVGVAVAWLFSNK